MKKTLLYLTVLVALALSSQAQNQKFSQKDTKVILMLNTAKWCPPCVKHESRVKEEVLELYKKSNECYVLINDLSNNDTKYESANLADKVGVGELATSNLKTGIIYLIHPKTKIIISEVSVARSSEEINTLVASVIQEN